MKFKYVILVVIVCFLAGSLCFAQEEKVNPVKKWWRNLINKNEEKKSPEMSDQDVEKLKQQIEAQRPPARNDMLEIIKNNLEIHGDDLTAKINTLVRAKNDKGEQIYKFKRMTTGEVLDFSDINEDELEALYKRIVNESVFIRTERINQQLRTIQNIPKPPTIPQVRPPTPRPPDIPKVYTAPRMPQPPQRVQLPDRRR